jgi:hypothetical protein
MIRNADVIPSSMFSRRFASIYLSAQRTRPWQIHLKKLHTLLENDVRSSTDQPFAWNDQNRAGVPCISWCAVSTTAAIDPGTTSREFFPVLASCPELTRACQQNGQPSPYVDPKYVSGGYQFNPALVAQQAQDPNNPAHPSHPKVGPVSLRSQRYAVSLNLSGCLSSGFPLLCTEVVEKSKIY